MQFEYKYSVFGDNKTSSTAHRFSQIIREMVSKIADSQEGNIVFEKGLDCIVAPLLYTRNQTYRDYLISVVDECKAIGCDAILVIGIGGSSLGASAVYEALGRTVEIPIYFLETIDPEQYVDLEGLLRDGGAVQVIIISKSGTTLETALNSSLAIDLLRQYRPKDWNRYVTVISDERSPLVTRARQSDIRVLAMPAVGGRFSVFTFVGLFPLALAGIDIDQFCHGACAELEQFVGLEFDSRAVISAQILYAARSNGYWVHDMFIWDQSLEQLGKWCRQLYAESLGKRENVHGETVETGMLPTVSIGTHDLHSMVQLYLGGPRQIFTTFVTATPRMTVAIPSQDWGNSGCAGKDIANVRQGLLHGVQEAYRQDKRPFMAINLEKSVYGLGQFMTMKILEVILLGALFELNVFDQPEVEKYKSAARQCMGDK